MAQDVEPQSRGGSPQRRSGGLRPLHKLGLVAVGVVGVLIAFVVLGSIVSIIGEFIKVIVIVAVLGGLAWLLVGRRRR